MKKEEIIIDIKMLVKKYKDFLALDNLNLQINKDEIFGFLGHNGAGKTTTVNILTSLLPPTSGGADICGFDISKDSTAYENLEYLAQLSGIKNTDKSIKDTLEFIDFRGFENKKVGEFSRGMKQRVGIAQAIIHKPEVLFLDEPTSGLDPMGIKKLREVILKINSEKGITIFLNTHLLSEVSKVCSTIGVLSHGRLIYKDSIENTLKKFKDEVSLEEIYFNIDSEKRIK